MKDTRTLILDASLQVFSEKGYTLATTLEISKQAGVSEMTLFRHFQTKNNLFLISIKEALGASLVEDLSIDVTVGISHFLRQLLHEKLTVISTHIKLIKMLIRETLGHTLPEDLAFTKLISNQVIGQITAYVDYQNLQIDAKAFADMVVGLLLRYAIMDNNFSYHLLDKKAQKAYLDNYIGILNI